MNMDSCSCYKKNSLENKKVSSLIEILKIISEESRLKILCILAKGEHCVCEIIEHLDFSQSLVSHHLKDLKDAGLIISDKRGLRVYYTLTEKGKHITNLIFKI